MICEICQVSRSGIGRNFDHYKWIQFVFGKMMEMAKVVMAAVSFVGNNFFVRRMKRMEMV